ncbi:MAG: putative Ig domain-containing protein [Planctomycetota bacterium]
MMSVRKPWQVACAATAIVVFGLLTACALSSVGQAPSITTTGPLAAGTLGQAYSFTFGATGAQPMAWTVVDGAPPQGLVLDATNGELGGTPTAEETAAFTVRATNAFGHADAEFSLRIGVAPAITTTALPDGTIGADYAQTLAATGTAPLTWALASGTLPDGIGLDPATGALGGTPTTAGSSTFTVSVSNAHGTDTHELTLVVLSNLTPPTITGPSSPLPGATLQSVYLMPFLASGTTPITWSVSAGSLPAGIQLDASAGVIAGTPTVVGMASFSITATNAAGTDTRPYQLTVSAGPNLSSIAPSSAPQGATVVLSGTAFQPITFANTVMFGATAATVLAASTTQLTVEVPHGINGTVNVTVSTGSLGTNALPFNVDATVVRFVDTNASGLQNGTSWANAYTDLGDALAAAQSGDEVWVAAGRYVPGTQRTDTFTLAANAPVYGGFAGSEGQRSQRNWVAHQTILSGDIAGDDSGLTNNGENAYHVVTAGSNTTLDGCIVRGGNADGSGGDAYGAGILASGTVTLAHLQLDWNSAAQDGGAVYLSSGTIQCDDSLFADNRATNSGGSVHIEAGTASGFARCVFTRNFASLAAAITSNVVLTCRDCVFAANSAWNVGVLWVNDDSLVRGCTFYNNAATGTRAITTNGDCQILDCIFRGGNSSLAWVLSGPGASATMTTSNMQGGLSGVSDGGGNSHGDPAFDDTNDLDGADDRFGTRDDGLMLGSGSPCVDTGTASGASATDVTGTSRPQGSGVDMGAYER